MSGFYGELALRGARGPAAGFGAMDAAMANWGPDAAAHWQEGPLTVGARLLQVASDDVADTMPLVDDDLVVLGHFRIDNRQAVGRSLGLSPSDVEALPDAQLLARAWRRWRQGTVEHLAGDWVCAVWDRQRQSLWLGRDAAGSTGLYYWHDAARLVFSTSLRALLAHPAGPRELNTYRIAQQLAFVSDPSQAHQTPYVGVRRLPGGHALRCDSGTVEKYCWWSPESLDELDWRRDGDYHDAFRELYTSVVTEQLARTAGPVAVMLSSGLDSGSIAALAAPVLAAGGRRLLAFTAVPHFAPDAAAGARYGDEGKLAREVAEFIGNIEFNAVASEQATMVGSIEAVLDATAEPIGGPSNAHWIMEILRRARACGVGLMLTGRGGNATVSWPGTGNLMPTLRRGEWRSVIAAFRRSEIGTWPTLKRQVLRPALTAAQECLERLALSKGAESQSDSVLNPRLAAEIDFYARAIKGRREFFAANRRGAYDPGAAHFRLGRREASTQGEIWMALGAAHQLEIRDPTVDRRLIEFCWRVPDRIFWASGRQRGLIRVGMSGFLPASVLRSTRRGLQGADVGHRILAERDLVAAALGRLEAHSLAREYLDLPKMRSVLQALDRGVNPTTTQLANGILLRGLSVGLFLTRF